MKLKTDFICPACNSKEHFESVSDIERLMKEIHLDCSKCQAGVVITVSTGDTKVRPRPVSANGGTGSYMLVY